MSFDWLRFFNQNHIEYRESGPNVSRGNVAIHCPFCGPADETEHLSVSLNGKGFRCWRRPEHSGKNPARLVQAIMRCTEERAREIVGQDVFVPTDFMARVKQQFTPAPAVNVPPIDIPPEFKSFAFSLPSSKPYVAYLRQRGFDDMDIPELTKRYGVRYCTSGPFRGRIIFVVRYNGEVVTWTGRSINKFETLRYKALSPDPERAEREQVPISHGPISHYLLWYDRLRRIYAETLFLVEGPFDALKVDMLGHRYGICATCFFTSAPTEPQVDFLHEICPQFKRRILLLDRGTLATGLRIGSLLSSLGIVTKQIPNGLKDPGEFTEHTFHNFVLALEREMI